MRGGNPGSKERGKSTGGRRREGGKRDYQGSENPKKYEKNCNFAIEKSQRDVNNNRRGGNREYTDCRNKTG